MEFNSSEQTVGWFKDRYFENTLTIRPPYQRKPIWSAKQKCYLVESILLGLPVPEVYIQQSISAKGESTYAIVDGQQRIRSVLQFIGAENDPMESEQNKFPLDKLKNDSRWRNKTFDELSEEEKRRFYGYKLAVRYLNTNNDDDVRDMFERLNKYLSPLKAQELRNATYTGPFIKLAEKLADDEYWAENRIVTPAAIRRMMDVEFMSELLIGVTHGPQGGSAKVIDEYYKQYEDYEDQFPDQQRIEQLFALTLGTVQKILPKIKGTRWGNKTDFYTFFVALANLLRSVDLPQSKVKYVRRSLDKFAKEIDRRLGDEEARVSKSAVVYVRAVEKGANDKKRRANRHANLIGIIKRYFKQKKKIS
ncbi:MAG: DUF262 domain-containing protein [Planctomycetota bacterium]